MHYFTERFISIADLGVYLKMGSRGAYKFLDDPNNPLPCYKIGVKKRRIDTWSPAFHKWLDNHLGWEGAGRAAAGPAFAQFTNTHHNA